MKLQFLLLLVLLAPQIFCKKNFPELGILTAPYTPNKSNGIEINYSVIENQAQFSKQVGVNVVWIDGGMADFSRYTLEQRKKLAEEWAKAGNKYDLYTIVHIGSTVLLDTLELAKHAQEVGADAFGVVPPYYSTLHSEYEVVQWMLQQQKAAPKLDIFYYHIPGSSRTNIKIKTLLEQAAKHGLTNLKGIKYVSEDAWDFLECVREFPHIKMMWAAEPKLRGFPLGATHAVLAEDFYAQTYLKMYDLYKKGEINKAQEEQLWKHKVDGIFSKYGGNTKRTVYKKLAGYDLGPPTFPTAGVDPKKVEQLNEELQKEANFFSEVYPSKSTFLEK